MIYLGGLRFYREETDMASVHLYESSVVYCTPKRIVVTHSTNTAPRYVVYSVGPIDLQAGDIVQIIWQFVVEIPEDQTRWIGIGRTLTRSNGAPPSHPTGGFTGVTVGFGAMFNADGPNMHHPPSNGSVCERINSDAESQHYNLYLYATDWNAPDDPQTSTMYLDIVDPPDQKYGALQVLIHRP